MNLSYEQFNMIFYIGLILALVFLIISIVLLFVLKIPTVIGELSGIAEKRAITKIKQGKYVSPLKGTVLKPNVQKARTTEKIDYKKMSNSSKNSNITNVVITADLNNDNKTELFNQTGILYEDNSFEDEKETIKDNTTYLKRTTLLEDDENYNQISITENSDFVVRDEIILFYSDEIIA